MANADRLIEIFSEAKARPAGAGRSAFLAEACGDDADLQEQVHSLLRASEGAGDFLKNAPPLSPEMEAELARLKPEEVGERIGPYKLREQIGEGGFGVVWVAEQQAPVRRTVALKIIKMGMDTREVVARFEQERQALAMMDHPNIARVFDAGATEHGRPFFVMELVRGIRITDYCDQANLPTAERLALFITVCHAVQHAHQKGIIHRDLKPSNILVTLHDGVPVPKVIDFGVAKATQGRLTDATIYTQFQQMIGTPLYMSPEQAEMSGLDVDTRTDIYALGVLLYELLTGRTPFDADTFRRVAYDEMRRLIREQEPPKPSTALDTMAQATLTTVAHHRASEPPKLIHAIRGDLDWIVMKALEKDRSRRYDTANGLAMDIQRHVANEPVNARPPSAGYRFQKLVRRNKLAFAAVGAVAAALILGVIASVWQAVRATRAEREQSELRMAAQTEAAKATAISDFLQELLRSSNPDALKGSEYTVRQLLDDFSAGLEGRLDGQPEVEATVRATIGRAYYRLGQPVSAQFHLVRALALQRRIFGGQSIEVAETLADCAWVRYEEKQYAEGELLAREALAIYRQRGASGRAVISALLVLQRFTIKQNRVADMEALVAEAREVARKSPGVDYPDLASMMHGLAEVKVRESQYAEGEALALEAVEIHRRMRGAEHPETAWALLAAGRAMRGQQKLAEAEAAFREALKIFRKYYDSAHPSVDLATSDLKTVLKARGDTIALEAVAREQRPNATPAELEKSFRRDISFLEKMVTESPADANYRRGLSTAYDRLSAHLRKGLRHEEADAFLSKALVLTEQLVVDFPAIADYRDDLASRYLAVAYRTKESLPMEAEKAGRRAVAIYEKLAADFPDQSKFLNDMAYSYEVVFLSVWNQDRIEESAEIARQAIAALERGLVRAPQHRAALRERQAHNYGHLAHRYMRLGNHAAAREAFMSSSVLFRQNSESGSLSVKATALTGEASNFELIGQISTLEGRNAEAQEAYRQALALHERIEAERLGAQVTPGWVDGRYTNMASLLEKAGTLEIALRMIRVLQAPEKALGPVGWCGLANCHYQLAALLRKHGHQTEAGQQLIRMKGVIDEQKKYVGEAHADVAASLCNLSFLYLELGDIPAAETTAREGLAMRRKFPGDGDPEAAAMLQTLGRQFCDRRKLSEAEPFCREAITAYEKLAQKNPENTDHRVSLGHSRWLLGEVLGHAGRRDESEAVYREALLGLEQAARDFPAKAFFRQDQAFTHRLIAGVVSPAGRVDDAARHYRAAIDLYAALAAELPQNLFYFHEVHHSTAELKRMLEGAGRPDAAGAVDYVKPIALSEQANANRRKSLGNEHLDVAAALCGLSFLHREQGDLPAAETTAREALAIRRKLQKAEHADVAHTLHLLAWNLHLQGKSAEAEAVSREELAMWRKLLGEEDLKVAWNLGDLTEFLRSQGKLADAETAIRESLTIRQKKLSGDHPDIVHSFKVLSDLLQAQGKPGEVPQ